MPINLLERFPNQNMPKRKRAARKPNQSVERSKLDKYLTLDWKEFYLLLIAWFLFVVLHFMIGVIFKINEEILPFLYNFIIPLFFLIALIYTVIKKSWKK